MNSLSPDYMRALDAAKSRLGAQTCRLLRGDEAQILGTAVSLVPSKGVLEAIPLALEIHGIELSKGRSENEVSAYRSLLTFALSLDAPQSGKRSEQEEPETSEQSLDAAGGRPKPSPTTFQAEIERRYP